VDGETKWRARAATDQATAAQRSAQTRRALTQNGQHATAPTQREGRGGQWAETTRARCQRPQRQRTTASASLLPRQSTGPRRSPTQHAKHDDAVTALGWPTSRDKAHAQFLKSLPRQNEWPRDRTTLPTPRGYTRLSPRAKTCCHLRTRFHEKNSPTCPCQVVKRLGKHYA
jgi:hypothetical protein